MAGKIRGITIELGGDASGLVKSMQTATKEVKNVQAALRDVNNLLKFSPTSTELLTQKQKLLREQVDATQKELEQEKTALEALQSAGDSDKTTKQQEALKRQIAETESKLKAAKKELSDFGSVGAQKVAALGGKFQELGGKIAEVGKGLTEKVTGPIAALGTASVAAFSSVDKGYDTIIKKTGATGETLEEMKDIFDSLAGTVPADWTQIGAAVGEVATRFGVAGNDLETLSGKFLKFALLNEQDVVTAVDGTQKALAAFGLNASSADAFLDTLNLTAQNTGVNVATLQAGLVANGAAFQELGLSIEQATLFMGQLELSGANSETVLNGMRRALKEATEEGIPLNEALINLQDTILNGTGTVDGLTAAYDLFGKSGDQIYMAVQNGTLDFENLGAAVVDAGGNINTTFEETQDPTDKFKTALQSLTLAGSDLGTTLLEVLRPAIEKVTDVVRKLREWWEGLSPEMQDTIVKIALVVAAIGPLVLIVGKVIGLIGTIMSLAPVLGTIIGALTGPIGLVVAAVAAAIAIGVLLYKNWDEIKAKAKEIWDKIKNFFIQTWENIKAKAKEIWQSIKDFFANTWQAIKDKVVAVWTSIKDFLSNTWQSLKDKAAAVWDGIKSAVTHPIETLKSGLSSAWDSIKTKASATWESVKKAITNPIDTAKDAVKNAIDRIKGFFKFDWSLPKLKMPHVSITGSFSLFPPSVPHFSIDWWKKAADTGAIFDRRTIFGGYGGEYFGAGDAAEPELLIGTNSLQAMIAGAMPTIDPAAIYEAVKQGAEAASLRAYVSTSDIATAAERGITQTQAASLRFRGAY